MDEAGVVSGDIVVDPSWKKTLDFDCPPFHRLYLTLHPFLEEVFAGFSPKHPLLLYFYDDDIVP